MRAILQAPVDLLWNGGIGTYVKAETESDADVGDRANDAVRVNGNQVRAKVVGEGGNLGVTQLGRIEFDLAGGRINTDAMDNSAGVDCSDHEVNIKILLDSLVTAGKVSADDRTDLLLSMTDEVGRLVLADNVEQNDLMGTSRANAASLLTVHARQIKDLVAERGLNRELEALPSEKEIRRRTEAGIGLDLTGTGDPDGAREAGAQGRTAGQRPARPGGVRRPAAALLPGHAAGAVRRRDPGAPAAPRDRHHDAGQRPRRHRRHHATPTGSPRTSASARSTRCAASSPPTRSSGSARCGARSGRPARRVPVAVTDRMTLDLRRLIDRAGRWLLNYRPQPLAVGAEINRFAEKVAALTPRMSDWLRGDDRAIVAKEAGEFASQGVPEDLAYMVATGLYQFSLLDVIDIADIVDRDPAEVADTYFALMDHLGTDGLLTAVSRLARDDRWHSLARLAIRDDIYGSLRALCFDVLAVGEPDETGEREDRGVGDDQQLPGQPGAAHARPRSTRAVSTTSRRCRWRPVRFAA